MVGNVHLNLTELVTRKTNTKRPWYVKTHIFYVWGATIREGQGPIVSYVTNIFMTGSLVTSLIFCIHFSVDRVIFTPIMESWGEEDGLQTYIGNLVRDKVPWLKENLD